MGFINYEDLLEKLLYIIVDKYPEFVAIGGYVLAVMAIGTIVLTIAIIYQSINVPVELTKKIYKDSKK